MSIFKLQDEPFKLHSGGESRYKIDLDSLDDGDWECLAYMVQERVGPFRGVWGVPRGGLKLATALRKYQSPLPYQHSWPFLVTDDILTTGRSMEEARLEVRSWPTTADFPVLGIVVYSRGPCPDWVRPLFPLWQP